MSRLMSIEPNDGNIDDITKGLEGLIRQNGGKYIPAPPENRNKIHHYELLDGSVFLEFVKLGHAKSIYLNLIGNKNLWELGSTAAKNIVDYLTQQGLQLQRHEIRTEEGVIYIKGARVSEQEAREKGAQLIDESPYFRIPEPLWWCV